MKKTVSLLCIALLLFSGCVSAAAPGAASSSTVPMPVSRSEIQSSTPTSEVISSEAHTTGEIEYSYVLDMVDMRAIVGLSSCFYGTDIENMLQDIASAPRNNNGNVHDGFTMLSIYAAPYCLRYEPNQPQDVSIEYLRTFSRLTFGRDVMEMGTCDAYIPAGVINVADFAFGITGGFFSENEIFSFDEQGYMVCTFDLCFQEIEGPKEFHGSYSFFFETLYEDGLRYTRLAKIEKNAP